MKLVITGGTGFIGRALCVALESAGHELVVLTRSTRPSGLAQGHGEQSRTMTRSARRADSPRCRFALWQPPASGPWERELDGADGVVNLAGEPIIARRWTAAQKQRLADSRVGTSRSLVSAIIRASRKPSVLVSASAIGYYGPRGDDVLDEAAPSGADFLSQLCRQWEDAAQVAQTWGVRVVRIRIGLVLARDGGVLAKMLPPFQWGLGGALGSGRQWMSWVHRDDLIGVIRWALEDSRLTGAVNATAPQPVTMRDFVTTLGQALHRPAIVPVPAFALRVLLGEMAQVVLTGQRVIPAAAIRLGYQFQYSTLAQALAACVTSVK